MTDGNGNGNESGLRCMTLLMQVQENPTKSSRKYAMKVRLCYPAGQGPFKNDAEYLLGALRERALRFEMIRKGGLYEA